MKEQDIKSSPALNTLDKGSFILGLSAALLAFYPLKDSLNNISISLFGWNLSVYSAGLVFLGLLLFSAYLYGLNNIRYSIPKILEWEFSRYLELGALIVYGVAFLFPLLICLFWCISSLVNQIPHLLTYKILISNLVGVITGVIASYVSIKFSYSTYKDKQDFVVEELEDTSVRSEIKIESSYNEGDFRVSLLNLFQALVSALRANLVFKIGVVAENLPDSQIIRISKDKGLLELEEVIFIEDLRNIRNKIAHNIDSVDLTKQSIIKLREKTKPILMKLNRKTTTEKAKFLASRSVK